MSIMDDWKLKATPVVRLGTPIKTERSAISMRKSSVLFSGKKGKKKHDSDNQSSVSQNSPSSAISTVDVNAVKGKSGKKKTTKSVQQRQCMAKHFGTIMEDLRTVIDDVDLAKKDASVQAMLCNCDISDTKVTVGSTSKDACEQTPLSLLRICQQRGARRVSMCGEYDDGSPTEYFTLPRITAATATELNTIADTDEEDVETNSVLYTTAAEGHALDVTSESDEDFRHGSLQLSVDGCVPDSPVEGSEPLQNSSSFDESVTQPPSESRKHASAKPAEDVDTATVDGRDSTSCAKDGARSGVAGDKNRARTANRLLPVFSTTCGGCLVHQVPPHCRESITVLSTEFFIEQ